MSERELRELDRRAVLGAERLVALVRPDQLGAPTPCAGWTLDDLLRHMTAQHRGFAAAARGRPADPADWAETPLGDDPVGAYRAASADVLDAFADDAVLDRKLDLYGYGSYPARIAFGMHFADYLAHGWDVAASIGAAYEPDDDLCQAGLRVAHGWPHTPEVFGPGGPFAASVDVPEDASARDRFLAYLGREPGWRPAP